MKKYKVVVEEIAVNELIQHVAFLSVKNQKAALELYSELFRVIDLLETMPERNPVYPTPYSTHKHRMAVHRYYLILYEVSEAESMVYVRRVLDGRANNTI